MNNRFRRKDKKLIYKNPRKPIETPKGFTPLAQAYGRMVKTRCNGGKLNDHIRFIKSK